MRIRFVHLLVGASLLASALAACGTDGGSTFDPNAPDGSANGDGGGGGPGTFGEGGNIFGDGAPDTTASLHLVPDDATLVLDGTAPKTQEYVLKAVAADGSETTVTPESVQLDRPDLAQLAAGATVKATASGPFAGTGTIHAIFHGHEATAKLHVVMHVRTVEPGVPPGAVTAIDGAANPASDPAIARLLYPYDKTVFPLGLASPLTMWNSPKAGEVYRVHLAQSNYTYDDYFVVGAKGQHRVDQAVWDRVTTSNAGDPLTMTLTRYDGTHVYATGESWTIAPASLRGAIYYWTSSNGGHLSKIRPGIGAQPELLNGGKCMGCHAVSADGSTLVAAVETGEPAYRPWVAFDLPSGKVRVDSATVAGNKSPTNTFAGNVAVNPNGKYTVFGGAQGTDGNTLHLGTTADGKTVVGSGVEALALGKDSDGTVMKSFAMPAFSPDGKRLALVQSSEDYQLWTRSILTIVDFDEASAKVSSPRDVASSAKSFATNKEGQAIAYPTFTPDSESVAYHVADHATTCRPDWGVNCIGTSTGTSAIWMQKVDGGAPVRLTALTDASPTPADHGVTFEPTFNPIQRGGYDWVVVTSMRDWGNEIVGTPDNDKKRLWVAAVDTATGAVDPSHPAFYLEGQEETTTNMRGFWALAACTATPPAGSAPDAGAGACTAGFECCSGFCDRGQCIDVTQVPQCHALGDACATTADCCNAGPVQCQGGTCQIPVN